jgi:hypothetical protein
MENLKTTLAAAGCTLGDVVSATRYLTDVAEQDDLNAVWASYLGAHRPTTTTVEVSRLATHANCKIEISVIACLARTAKSRASTARRSQGRAERKQKELPRSRRTTARPKRKTAKK